MAREQARHRERGARRRLNGRPAGHIREGVAEHGGVAVARVRIDVGCVVDDGRHAHAHVAGPRHDRRHRRRLHRLDAPQVREVELDERRPVVDVLLVVRLRHHAHGLVHARGRVAVHREDRRRGGAAVDDQPRDGGQRVVADGPQQVARPRAQLAEARRRHAEVREQRQLVRRGEGGRVVVEHGERERRDRGGGRGQLVGRVDHRAHGLGRGLRVALDGEQPVVQRHVGDGLVRAQGPRERPRVRRRLANDLRNAPIGVRVVRDVRPHNRQRRRVVVVHRQREGCGRQRVRGHLERVLDAGDHGLRRERGVGRDDEHARDVEGHDVDRRRHGGHVLQLARVGNGRERDQHRRRVRVRGANACRCKRRRRHLDHR